MIRSRRVRQSGAMPRLFVAIDLPDAVAEQLMLLAGGLPGARWVPRDQLHLTLRFIGDVDGAVFHDVAEALAGVASAPLELSLHGLGYFPPRGEPHALWAGLKRSEPLMSLQRAVERTLQHVGIPPEGRKFHPHVTLARLKDTPQRRVAEWLAGNGLFETGAFAVTEMTLYSSVLGSSGATHSVEATYPFASEGDVPIES
jgi:2'-5' RNA ligase